MKTRFLCEGASPWVALALALCFALPVCGAGGLEFSKDTVVEDAVFPDTVALRNSTDDTIFVDTIVALLDTNGMEQCEVEFLAVREGLWRPGIYLAVRRGGPGGAGRGFVALAGDDRIAVPPAQSVSLVDFNFDICILCPVAETPSVNDEWQVGDSIWVTLVFLAPGASDTLVLKGIREESVGTVVRGKHMHARTLTEPKARRERLNSFLLDGRTVRWSGGEPSSGAVPISFPGASEVRRRLSPRHIESGRKGASNE